MGSSGVCIESLADSFDTSIAAATAYIELISKEADNNVKLICLDRLNELKEKYDRVLDDLLMDMLRVLSRWVSRQCRPCHAVWHGKSG